MSRWNCNIIPGCQSRRIIKKFGGVTHLRRSLEAIGVIIERKTFYRWQWESPKGTGGVIPAHRWKAILDAARAEGVMLTESDFNPHIDLNVLEIFGGSSHVSRNTKSRDIYFVKAHSNYKVKVDAIFGK